MRFVDPAFLFQFLPPLLTVYFLVFGLDGVAPRLSGAASRGAMLVLIGAGAWVVWSSPLGIWWLLTAATTWGLGLTIEGQPASASTTRKALLGIGIAANAAMLAWTRWTVPGRAFAFAGASVLFCHAVAFLVDVHRGRSPAGRGLLSALYLVQFPVLPAGPILRYPEFDAHYRPQQIVGLGAFTYGMRRLVIGLVKVVLVAGTLARPVDAIFALPPARLGIGAAWLAALAFSLELYFRFSGYADIAIGVGRMFGLRYPENFRRPYLADSVREFWRRWHVTAITWLRDYLSLPMAGRDRPTPRLFVHILVGFTLLALWHGATGNVVIWALYAGAWLAIEAIGFGAVVERWPRLLRHVYLLTVVVAGWVILRADTAQAAWLMLSAMAGGRGATPYPVWRFVDLQVWTALIVAIVGAGPLVPWISRWRVTVDATAAALVMMVSALSLWIWRGLTALAFWKPPRRPPASAGGG